MSSPPGEAEGATTGSGALGALAAGAASPTNLPLPWSWSSSASNSSSVISSDAAASLPAAGSALEPEGSSRAVSSCSNSLSVMSPDAGAAGSSASGSGSGSGSKASATGSGSDAPAGSARRDNAASSSGVAGVGSERSRTWLNISLTVSSAWSTTSISSASTRRAPLRRMSNTFSAMWQHSTRAFSWRKPAPPLTVWKPRKMALSRSISSGRLSSSTSCSDNCSSISPASTRKSWRISSSASKLIRRLP